MRALLLPVALLLLAAAAPAVSWDPAPWLADLQQIRAAVDRDYPNRDWLTGTREANLDAIFERAAADIRAARDDADARRALDALIRRFRDGHVELRWPEADPGGASTAPPPPQTAAAFCAARGYDAGQVTPGTAAVIPGYRSIDSGSPLAAGLVESAGTKVGVIRIGVFDPHGYPALCEQAVVNTRIAPPKPCDEVCEDTLITEAYVLMTRGLMTGIERLRAGGATVMMIDLTRNGGGSEWAEAAARIVSPVPLRSAPVMVMPAEHWVTSWRKLAGSLHKEAATAGAADRNRLLDLAARADKIADGLAPCTGSDCKRLAQAGYGSGLLPELKAGTFDGKAWGPQVFSAAQFPYRDSVWRGPLIVLVDDETWSAAEQFSAVLQDNGAAIIMGTRSGGAGCGHLDGDTPVTLPHSKATLHLPNCARLRKDGSNEVNGIVPDVPTGVRWHDGPRFAGQATAARLPEAIAAAQRLAKSPKAP
jgi:hypothetical protein